jgi:hypothetical protein
MGCVSQEQPDKRPFDCAQLFTMPVKGCSRPAKLMLIGAAIQDAGPCWPLFANVLWLWGLLE